MTYQINKKDFYIITRKQKKILLKDIAEYIGCSIPHISQWENNKSNMADDKVVKYYQYIDKHI